MIAVLDVMAGIAWDPTIRGYLTVLLGTTVLMGSVWLLLATNLGVRLASLAALAGFFGWMAIMGVIWWMYGIGYVGDAPTWEVEEFVASDADLLVAQTGDSADLSDLSVVTARELTDTYCPGLIEGVTDVATARVEQGDSTIEYVPDPDHPEYCTDEVGELFVVDEAVIADRLVVRNDALADDDPRKRTDAELEEAFEDAVDDETRRRGQVTLSALASVAPGMIDDAVGDGLIDFAGWDLKSSAEAGEAQASADAWLIEHADVSGFDSSDDFVLLNTYEQGGKDVQEDPAVLARVWGEIQSSATPQHPTHYAVVEVQRSVQKEPVAGEALPFAEADDGFPPQYVVMARNLGDLRLSPALVAVGSGLIFAGLCLMMHRRDQAFWKRRDEVA